VSNAINGGMLVSHATEIETASGRFMDLLQPAPDAIDPDDLAHALGMTCRYGGHVVRFYSVAEHVLLVADLVRELGREDLVDAALLHDAAEAYLGDVVSPLKYALRYVEHNASSAMCDLAGFRGAYAQLTERLERAIGERFDVDPALFDDPDVKLADMWALRIEAAELTRSRGANWRWPGELPNGGYLPATVPWEGGLPPDIAAIRLAGALRNRTSAEGGQR
jgi:hypothetical protein